MARQQVRRVLDSRRPLEQGFEGIADVYDASLSHVLQTGLRDADSLAMQACIRAIGKTKERRFIRDLLVHVEEATLVTTKLAWIDAMVALGALEARPVLKKWASWPHEDVTRRAREALETLAE